MPALINLIESKIPTQVGGFASQSAATALGKIGEKASSAVPTLARLMEFGDEGARRHAAEALGKIGKLASSTFPLLVEAGLEDGKDYAEEALALIEPSFYGLYLCEMLELENGMEEGRGFLTARVATFIALTPALKDDPSTFMLPHLKITRNPAVAKAWLIYQTAGDDSLRWLHSQLEADSNNIAADPKEIAARADFLKGTLNKVRANKDAKDLFPEAHGKLLSALENVAAKVGR